MRARWAFGEQLMLPFEGGLERVRIPWDGRSPRALTRVGLGLILKAQAKKSVSDFEIDLDRLDLFAGGIEGPPENPGAPLLSPLPWEVGNNG